MRSRGGNRRLARRFGFNARLHYTRCSRSWFQPWPARRNGQKPQRGWRSTTPSRPSMTGPLLAVWSRAGRGRRPSGRGQHSDSCGALKGHARRPSKRSRLAPAGGAQRFRLLTSLIASLSRHQSAFIGLRRPFSSSRSVVRLRSEAPMRPFLGLPVIASRGAHAVGAPYRRDRMRGIGLVADRDDLRLGEAGFLQDDLRLVIVPACPITASQPLGMPPAPLQARPTNLHWSERIGNRAILLRLSLSRTPLGRARAPRL